MVWLMLFGEQIRALDKALDTTTIRQFDGGWNVIDSDLNLSSRYAKLLDNMFRGDGGYYQKRYGTRAFAAGDDGDIVTFSAVSHTLTTTISTPVVNVAWAGHGLLTGDHVTLTVVSGGDLNGIPNDDFLRSHEITWVDADNFTIRVATNATSSGSAARDLTGDTNTHTIHGVLVNTWYFQDHVIAVDTRGEVHKIDGTGAVTTIWSTNIAAALAGTPAGWGAMTFASAAAFKGELIICNGIDKPILIDNALAVGYLQDLGTGSNANVPIGRYVIAMPDYLIIAGDPNAPDRIHISNQSTSGTWLSDPAPNNATQMDVGQFTSSFNQTIRGLGRFRSFLLVVFDDTIVPVQVGVYNDSGDHVPTVDDELANHGAISHRSIVSLGNDLLMNDHIGVPTVAHAALTQTLRPTRVSELIDPAIQRNVLRLSVGTAEDKVFAVYNPRDRQYMLFMPDYEEGQQLSIPYNSVETLEVGSGTIRLYMSDPHELEEGKTINISGLADFDGLTSVDLNKDHVVTAILSDFIFEVDTGGAAVNGYVLGGGASGLLTYSQQETIGYIYTSFAAVKVKAWARFRQWNWRCACTTQLGRIIFGHDRRLYVYGSREDPIAGDYFTEYDDTWANSTAYTVGDRVYDSTFGRVYRCTIAHTSSAGPDTFDDDRIAHPTWWERYEGDEIDFRWELPWADFDKRIEKKNVKYVGLDTTGTASFTLETYVDRLYKDAKGVRTPLLSAEFVGGDVRGFGGQLTPFGSARLAADERPYPWPFSCKIAKIAFAGSSSRPFAVVGISFAYARGSIYR